MADIVDTGYFDVIHDSLMSWIGNEIAVAGMMGNFYSESRCSPNRKQGDTSQIQPTEISIMYTLRVDVGAYSESKFVHDSIGYGLAQWTYYSRKQGLFNVEPLSTSSIGDIYRQLKFVKQEIYPNKTMLRTLQSATDIDEITRYICNNYEKPGKPHMTARIDYAHQFYERYGGTSKHFVSVQVYGGGHVNVNPSSGEEGTVINIEAIPDDECTFETWEIVSGIHELEYGLTEPVNTFIIKSENVYLTARFSGVEPPPSPIPSPTPLKPKRHKMPIWMYYIIYEKRR